MKKKAIFATLFSLALCLTGCGAPPNPQAFETAARDAGFRVERDIVNEDVWRATKDGCTVTFYYEDSTDSAKALYEKGRVEKAMVSNSTGAKQQSETNLFVFNHYEVKTATKFVFGTRHGNAFLYHNGARECDKAVEELAEKMKMTLF